MPTTFSPEQQTSSVETGPPTHAKTPASHQRKRRFSWKTAAASAFAVALAAGAYWYSNRSQTPQYQTAAVDRGDIESAITATGNCNAVVTVQVGSQVSGNIVALYADFNTKVKQGQLVARIDPAPFQAAVDQAKAMLQNAQASVITARATVKKSDSDVANAQANVVSQKANVVKAQSAVADAKIKNERRIQLVKQGIIAQEDADTAQATYDQAVASLEAANAELNAAQSAVESAQAQSAVAQAQLESAQAQVNQDTATLKQAQLNLDHTEIRAPVDGTVVSRNMDVGQTVAASFQAPTIFLIAQDLTKMQVDTNVDEADVGPVRVGQQANFRVDAYPGLVFPGAVSQIRQAPINVQNVITYDVVVQVANPDLKLFPGMTANVRIVTGRSAQALRIPVAALRFRPTSDAKSAAKSGAKSGSSSGQSRRASGTEQSVYILDQGQLKRVHVQLGLSDGNFMEVLNGLSDGQRVVTGSAVKTASSSSQSSPGATRRIGF